MRSIIHDNTCTIITLAALAEQETKIEELKKVVAKQKADISALHAALAEARFAASFSPFYSNK